MQYNKRVILGLVEALVIGVVRDLVHIEEFFQGRNHHMLQWLSSQYVAHMHTLAREKSIAASLLHQRHMNILAVDL